MNIGIITPFDSANCGAYLQAYANKMFLEKNGHNVVFVKWRNSEERKKEFFVMPKTLKEFVRFVQKILYTYKNYNIMTNSLNQIKSIDLFSDEFKKLDCIVVGSDEIWNIKVSQYQNKIFYGFNTFNIPAIAYSPSAGQASVHDFKEYPWVKTCLENLLIAGVRDENTKKIVEEISGIETPILCDPTLLIDISELKLDETKKIKNPYLLVYSYSVPKVHQKYLRNYAKKYNLKLIALCMYQNWCDINISCSPLEFNSYIKNAFCVYTTTFHGTIFTLLNHKKCAIYATSKKLKDLVSWTEKKDVLISENEDYVQFEHLLNYQSDYSKFEKIIKGQRKFSEKRYQEVLEAISK